MLIRKRYDSHNRFFAPLPGPDEGRTKQSDAQSADINFILKQWEATGVNKHLAQGTPVYGDFSNVDDYQSAVDAVQDAADAFADLPSHIRKEFDYDPATLLTFMSNPDNESEAIRLGLVEAKLEPRTSPSPVAGGESTTNPETPSTGEGSTS